MEWEHLEKESLEAVLKQLFIINYCVHLDADRTQNKWSGKAASPRTRVQYILILRNKKLENGRTTTEWRADKHSHEWERLQWLWWDKWGNRLWGEELGDFLEGEILGQDCDETLVIQMIIQSKPSPSITYPPQALIEELTSQTDFQICKYKQINKGKADYRKIPDSFCLRYKLKGINYSHSMIAQ